MTRNEKITAIIEHMTTWHPEVILGFAQEAMRDQLKDKTNPQITEVWEEVSQLISDNPQCIKNPT